MRYDTTSTVLDGNHVERTALLAVTCGCFLALFSNSTNSHFPLSAKSTGRRTERATTSTALHVLHRDGNDDIHTLFRCVLCSFVCFLGWHTKCPPLAELDERDWVLADLLADDLFRARLQRWLGAAHIGHEMEHTVRHIASCAMGAHGGTH